MNTRRVARGPHHIQIALRRPVKLNLLCRSEEEALKALRAVCRPDEPQ